MSLEVRQLVLRARVRDERDDDDEDAGEDDSSGKARAGGCGGGGEADACEDKESLKEEILAACRVLVREELRALRER